VMRHRGNEGYTEEADALTRQYESVRFIDVHGPVLHLLPTVPRAAASRLVPTPMSSTKPSGRGGTHRGPPRSGGPLTSVLPH
jgi:hypothetical protein